MGAAALQVDNVRAASRVTAGTELSAKMHSSLLRLGHSRLRVANQRVQLAKAKLERQWNTTITQFDEVVEHLIDGSASSEDECTDKLTEAKRRLYEMHEKVKFMADHVSVAENRTEKIIKEITEY